MSTPQDSIAEFLSQGPYAVVGASADRSKYGNKVLRCFLQHGWEVHPIHPKLAEVEGLKAFATLAEVPVQLRCISIITPPAITERVVEEAAQVGVRIVWMQPGAESPAAVARAKALGMQVIAGGPCLLVVAGFRETYR